MIGGEITEVVLEAPGRVWVEVEDENEDRCGIRFDPDGHRPRVGDKLWWQGDHCFLTPQGGYAYRDTIEFDRIGYSGVDRPEWAQWVPQSRSTLECSTTEAREAWIESLDEGDTFLLVRHKKVHDEFGHQHVMEPGTRAEITSVETTSTARIVRDASVDYGMTDLVNLYAYAEPEDPDDPACLTGPVRKEWLRSLQMGDPVWVRHTQTGNLKADCIQRVDDHELQLTRGTAHSRHVGARASFIIEPVLETEMEKWRDTWERTGLIKAIQPAGLSELSTPALRRITRILEAEGVLTSESVWEARHED